VRRLDAPCQRADHGGVVVDAGGSVERQPSLGGPSGGFDVEVVQHLEVIGDEADGRDDDAVDGVVVTELIEHLEHVGSEPRLGSATGALPGDLPTVAFDEPEPVGDGLGGRAQLVGVVIAGGDDPLRERVGGEQHPCPGRHRRQPASEVVDEELDERRLGRPRLDAADGHVVRRGCLTGPPQVLTDRVGREVRGEHESDDMVEPAARQIVDRRLDHRFGVLEAEHHLVPVGLESVELALQRVALGFGQLRQG
jgi:hypothetical protein